MCWRLLRYDLALQEKDAFHLLHGWDFIKHIQIKLPKTIFLFAICVLSQTLSSFAFLSISALSVNEESKKN